MQSLRLSNHAPRMAGDAGPARRTMVVVRGTHPTWVAVKPADSRESPFRDLELMELWDGTGKTRVRQHVNPFNIQFQQPTPAPDWPAVFDDPSLPLALDIGSGYGRFLMLLQRNNPTQRVNYLGLEIRKPIVDRANEWAARLGQTGRLHYIFTNATISLQTLLKDYPGPVSDVFVQFPDPHFKRRHHKRRVVQPQLVAALRDVMPAGGRLLLQSDVEEVAVAMRNMFEKYAGEAFELAPQHRECAVFLSPERPLGHAGGCDGQQGTSGSPPSAAETREATTETSRPAETLTAEAPERTIGSGCNVTSSDHQRSAVASHDLESGSGYSSNSGSDGDDDNIDPRDGGSDDDDIANMVSDWARGGWLVDNPVGTPTEREHYVTQKGLPVYRVALVRRSKA